MTRNLKTHLDKLAAARIYFGHHSVGDDMVRGLELIARDAGVDTIHVVDLPSSAFRNLPRAFFAHSRVGRNGDPKGKVDAFARRLQDEPSPPLDIAFMKFCYVDFDPDTDVSNLFEYYRSTIDRLAGACPTVSILHATVPLRARKLRPKDRVRLLLGRPPWQDLANSTRHRFNELVLGAFGPHQVVDIAGEESTNPDGTRAVSERGGRAGPGLSWAYTDDGGHLNEAGQRKVAAEMVRVLAQNLERPTPAR